MFSNEELDGLINDIERLYAERDRKLLDAGRRQTTREFFELESQRIVEDYRILLYPLEMRVRHIEIKTNARLAKSNYFHGWAMIALTIALVVIGAVQAIAALRQIE